MFYQILVVLLVNLIWGDLHAAQESSALGQLSSALSVLAGEAGAQQHKNNVQLQEVGLFSLDPSIFLPKAEFAQGVAYTIKRANGKLFTLYIKNGDMFQQGAEAVVEAAANPPIRGAGVSKVVHDKITKYQQKNPKAAEAEQLLAQKSGGDARFYGQPAGWQVGSAWLNSNDFVRIEYNGNIMRVIHATGPNCGLGEDILLLRPAYKNALIEAEKGGLKSVVFPLISIGIFDCPVAEATTIPVETILDYMSDGHNSSLQEVDLMAYDNDEHYDALVNALNKWIEKHGG